MKKKSSVFDEDLIRKYKAEFKTKTLKEVVDPHLTYNRFKITPSAVPHTFLVSKPDQMLPIWSLLAGSLETIPVLHIDAEAKIQDSTLALVVVSTPFLDTVVINTTGCIKREKGSTLTDWDAVMKFFPREFRERMFFDRDVTFIGSGIQNEELLFHKLTDDLPKEKVNLYLEDIPLCLLRPKTDSRIAFLYGAHSDMPKAAFDLSPKFGIGFVFTSLQKGYFKPLKKDSWKSPITWRFYRWNNLKFDYESQQVSYCQTDGVFLPLSFLSCGYFLFGNTPLVKCFRLLQGGRFMNELGALVRLCAAHFLNLPPKMVAEIFRHGSDGLASTKLPESLQYELKWIFAKNGLVIKPYPHLGPPLNHPVFVNQSPLRVNVSHSPNCQKSNFPGLSPEMNFSDLMEVVETCQCGCRLTSFTGDLEDPTRDSFGRPVPQFNVDISWRSTSLLDAARDQMQLDDLRLLSLGRSTREEQKELEDWVMSLSYSNRSTTETGDYWNQSASASSAEKPSKPVNCEALDERNLNPLMREYIDQWRRCIKHPNAVSRLFIRPDDEFIPDLEKNWKIFSSVLKLRHRFYFTQLAKPNDTEKSMVKIFHEIPVGERNLIAVVVACRNLSSMELKCRMATKCLELGAGMTVDTLYFLAEGEAKGHALVDNYSYRGNNTAIWTNIFTRGRFPSIRHIDPPLPDYCPLEYCPVRSAHLSADCEIVESFCPDCLLHGHSSIQHNQRAFLEFMADGEEKALFENWPKSDTLNKDKASYVQPRMAFFRVLRRLKEVRGKTMLAEFDVRARENADLLAFKRVMKGYSESLMEMRLITGRYNPKSRFLGYFPEPKKGFMWGWLDKVPPFMQCQSRTWVRHSNLHLTSGLIFKWSPELRDYLTCNFHD